VRRDLGTALMGGGVGGLLDALYATVLWGFILGDHPAGVWQSVAAGLTGKASYEGGNATALLGLVLHFFIACVMALVYVRAARRLAILVQRPVLMGVIYGFALYLVMNFVVVPLSAIGFHAPSMKGAIRALIPHVVFVGPAIALIASRRAARTGSTPTS
jgi:uncharacterized membrane protein YagU involved in acid resistance